MATFNARPQTHLRCFLSCRSGIRGSRHPRGSARNGSRTPAIRGTWCGHGRGEIAPGGTRPARRHPEGARRPRERAVSSPGRVRPGQARPPVATHATRPARASSWRSGRAVVHRHTPFVIRLRDRTAADSTVARRAGRHRPRQQAHRHRGIHRPGGEPDRQLLLQLDHRGGRDPRQARRARRLPAGPPVANLRYRAPRFPTAPSPRAGSRRPCGTASTPPCRGWTGSPGGHPSVPSTWSGSRSTPTPCRPGRPLEGVEYQQGTLAGYEVREYLLAKWGRTCAYCGAPSVR